jgi:hypothetical protein
MTEAKIRLFFGIGFGKLTTEVELNDYLFRVHDVMFLFFRINVVRAEKIR